MIKNMIFATATLLIAVGFYFILRVSPIWLIYVFATIVAWVILVAFLEILRR